MGSAFALEPQDFLSPLIRNLGSMLVKGAEPLQVVRTADTHGQARHAAHDLADTWQISRAATEHDACWQQAIVSRALDLLQDHVRDLFHPSV